VGSDLKKADEAEEDKEDDKDVLKDVAGGDRRIEADEKDAFRPIDASFSSNDTANMAALGKTTAKAEAELLRSSASDASVTEEEEEAPEVDDCRVPDLDDVAASTAAAGAKRPVPRPPRPSSSVAVDQAAAKGQPSSSSSSSTSSECLGEEGVVPDSLATSSSAAAAEIAASPSKRAAPSRLPSSSSETPTDRSADEEEPEMIMVDGTQLVMMPLLGGKYVAGVVSSSFDGDDVTESFLPEDIDQALQFEVEP